jgi:uncharacterized protein (TIGR02246 family)
MRPIDLAQGGNKKSGISVLADRQFSQWDFATGKIEGLRGKDRSASMTSSLHLESFARSFAFRLHMTVFVAAVLLGAHQARADTPSCVTPKPLEISQVFDRWAAELHYGAVDKVADFYADDATLIPTSSTQPYKGKEAIRSYYGTLLARHPKPVVISRQVTPGCNSAIITGFILYRITGERKGTRELLGGRYMTEFSMQNGAWRIVRHTLAADTRKLDQPFESSML